ncbi:MAG: hypothetical protein KF773_17530 [Deltaproteobacteria bacterium]|nr:hypothetical protein [Deltaproteobacteria bacterium]MCW5805650.1 hypothetical protein [Deltaproteobacteria bacterium]
MRRLTLATILVAAACGDNLRPATDATPGGDAPPIETPDAGIDAPPAPAMITISGTAIERRLNGAFPLEGVIVEAFTNQDEQTPISSVVTDTNGIFSLQIVTGGLALDGFLKARKTGLKDTYLYPAGFVAADLGGVPLQMLTATNYDTLSVLAQGNQMPGKGMVALQVLDGQSIDASGVFGATVTSAPAATVRYNNNGIPSSTATTTGTDGVAYLFNVQPNVSVFVGASKFGTTFQSHGLKARPDQLTTTLITPP